MFRAVRVVIDGIPVANSWDIYIASVLLGRFTGGIFHTKLPAYSQNNIILCQQLNQYLLKLHASEQQYLQDCRASEQQLQVTAGMGS